MPFRQSDYILNIASLPLGDKSRNLGCRPAANPFTFSLSAGVYGTHAYQRRPASAWEEINSGVTGRKLWVGPPAKAHAALREWRIHLRIR